jgi:alpha-beta hydrolase superfamily lysophospholipase
MRLLLMFVFILGLAAAAYVGATGYFLAKAASGLLQVGAIASAISQAKPPEDPMALGYRGNPMVALSLPFQVVTIETALGPAEAWAVPAPGAERGRAIYVHGIAGAREDGYRHLSILHEAGWSVLLITYRNDPSAPDGPENRYGFGLLEWPDLEAAVAQFSPGPDGPGLLIVAESMGGAILGQFLAQSPLADRVAAVALDSPGLSFRAVIGHLAEQGGKPLPGAMAWAAGLLLPHLSDLPLDRAEVLATYAAFAGPLFIAHGAADRIVPIGPSQNLATARTGPTTALWTGADHLGSYAEDPAAYRSAFRTFLDGLTD